MTSGNIDSGTYLAWVLNLSMLVGNEAYFPAYLTIVIYRYELINSNERQG